MKSIIITTFILASFASNAQVICQTYENNTYCSDGTSYNQSGSTIYKSDGTTYYQSGNTIYGSNGITYLRDESTISGSDGTYCTYTDNLIYCE